ncbi:tetrapyrrole methylase [Haematococcus lacustris]
MCHIVGAGPGPADLLTVRAARLLQSAKVVVYDDLGAEEALDLCPADCQRIYVGKRGGSRTSSKQADIDRLLVQLCQQGEDVVRLKGGCPSVFSRVASEQAALQAAQVPYTLVPGVSSALAGPLMAGFPLTDKLLSCHFGVVSGHQPSAVNWAGLRQLDSLVVLMGGAALPDIVKHCLAAGWAPETAVCIIHAAATPSQRIWHSTLDSVMSAVGSEPLSPCIIVAGGAAGIPQALKAGAGG